MTTNKSNKNENRVFTSHNHQWNVTFTYMYYKASIVARLDLTLRFLSVYFPCLVGCGSVSKVKKTVLACIGLQDYIIIILSSQHCKKSGRTSFTFTTIKPPASSTPSHYPKFNVKLSCLVSVVQVGNKRGKGK